MTQEVLFGRVWSSLDEKCDRSPKCDKRPCHGQLRIYNIICSTVVVPGAGATKVECVLKQIKMIRDRARAVR